MTQNHKTLWKATNWTSAFRSHCVVWLPRRRRNTYWRNTSIDSCWSIYVNRRVLPPRTCRKLWLTQIKSPTYITHWDMRAPTGTSFVDLGASHHTRTPNDFNVFFVNNMTSGRPRTRNEHQISLKMTCSKWCGTNRMTNEFVLMGIIQTRLYLTKIPRND